MEEEKKVNQQTPNQGGENGGRRKRKRHRGGKGGNGGNNAVNQTVQQSQGKKQGQAQPSEPQQKPHKNQNGNGGKNNAQPQKQSQPKNQNGGGRDEANKQNHPKSARKNSEQPKKEENRKDTYLYSLDGNLYVNLTNKCSNGCDFCVRNERSSYFGNYLWLKNGDPTAEKVISVAKGYGDLTRFKEVVFCGFGEPTYRMQEMLALCDYFHEKGLKTRLNTNGQGELINKRDITQELVGKIDFVNVSLNASNAELYKKICRSQFGENGFGAMVEFAKECKRQGVNVRFSIVDCIGEEEVDACKALADSVRVPLYVRDYITDS